MSQSERGPSRLLPDLGSGADLLQLIKTIVNGHVTVLARDKYADAAGRQSGRYRADMEPAVFVFTVTSKKTLGGGGGRG